MNKKLFMLQKMWRDFQNYLDPKPIYTISNHLHSDLLEYPFIFDENLIRSGKKQALIKSFDTNGIPLNGSYIDVVSNELSYYPITIGQVGISVYQTYLQTKSENDKIRFLKFADWFMANRTESENNVYWLTSVPKPEYKVEKPWKSAFTQSRAISILIRAYQLTEAPEYLPIVQKALHQLYVPFNAFGVTVPLQSDAYFYEEYPASEPTMVLDGHLFVLFGLMDVLKHKDKIPAELYHTALDLFERGINGLIQTLPSYDMGFWVKFNLCGMEHYPEIDPCTIGYLKLILAQLEALERYTKNEELSYYKTRFATYLRLKNILKMYQVKFRTLKKLNRL